MNEGSTGIAGLFGLNAGLFLAQLINFALVIWILRRFVFKPLLGVMDARADKMEQGLKDAEAAAKARSDAEAQSRQMMMEANKERDAMIDKAHQEAMDERKKMQEETTAALDRQLEEARERLKADREAMMKAVTSDVSRLVVSATQKIGLAVSSDKSAQQNLVQAALDEFKSNL